MLRSARRASSRSLPLALLVTGLTALACLVPAAQDGSAPPPAVPTTVRAAMLAGDHADAAARLARLGEAQPDEADFWRYLEGVALHHAGELERAGATLATVESDFPESRWLHKARFRLADVLRELGRFDEAEAIWEDEARRLRSAERQGELAEIYLAIADDLSTPVADDDPGARQPDYVRAHSLYAQVLELGSPPESRARARFRMGVCRERQENWQHAAQEFDAYLAEFDPARWTEAVRRARGADHGGAEASRERLFDARLRRGRALLVAGHRAEARRVLADLASDARAAAAADGTDDEARAALARVEGDALWSVAATHVGTTREVELAVAALERFLERAPDHPEASPARFAIGQRWAEVQRDADALDAWATYLAKGPVESDDAEVREQDARLRRRAHYGRGTLLVRQGRFGEAITVFEEYVGLYPNGSDWAAAQQGIVDAEYRIGLEHRTERDWHQARAAWTAFLERHPLDPRAKQIYLDLGELYASEADDVEEGGDATRAAELRRSALAQWKRLVSKFPRSDEASRALFRSGELLERELDELEEAIATYRRCDFGAYHGHAIARLTAMTQPELSVTTERSFRAGEAAELLVRTRNVEELEVRLYEIDLEAYFRRYLTHERVEHLDLDLIAADETIELAVEGYRRFAPLERRVALPLEGAGVWAASVSDGERRATTLIVKSDVDVVVKSSRREVLVLAVDRTSDAPATGVRVLAAIPDAGGDGALTIEELTTGADGVARARFDELEQGQHVRVLALSPTGIASDGVTLEGLGVGAALAPRGYVYTDRPAYRPGQDVRWRAIPREVRDGAYASEPGRRHRVEIVDSQGRVVHAAEQALGEFGTLSGELALDAFAPTGSWQVRVHAPGGAVHAGSFRVEEYRLRKVELAFELERDVFHRGESVDVEVAARWYWGEPVADAPLRLDLPGLGALDTRTDADGRARATFETRDLPEDGTVRIVAHLPEEGVSESAYVWIATRGFTASLSASRDVVVAGEPFEVTLRTSTPGGEWVARVLALEVLARESARDGRFVETLLDTVEVTTDEETGTGRHTLALERGGTILLRARGVDRYGNPITAETTTFVSDADDDVRLRVLADDLSVDVGEAVAVRVLDRTGGGLALVTFEGETILEHRVVRLAAGTNPLELDVEGRHAPNFVLAVAAMRENELHTASAEFGVARRLTVEVTPEATELVPGATARLALRTTDGLGNPVSAELSVAVVDEALFDLYADPSPDPRRFFESGTRRVAALRTSSSCGFRYEGATAEIAQAILDELERQEADRKWGERSKDARVLLAELASESRASGPSSPGAGFFRGPGDSVPFESEEMDEDAFNDAIGLGGGAGGKFGGRFGGRKKMRAAGGSARPRGDSLPAETAFWTPAVVTDADGRATVEFVVPERSTRWRATVRGVGPDTLLGQTTSTLVSRAELVLELVTPGVLTEGDEPTFVARVHAPADWAGADGVAELKLRVGTGAARRTLPARVELTPGRVAEAHFPLGAPLGDVGELALELECEATLGADADARTLAARETERLEVRPWGLELAAARSGVLTDSASVRVELPAGRDWVRRTLEVVVGPSLDAMLFDEALGGVRPRGGARIAPQADVASELLGVLGVRALAARTGRADVPEARTLLARAEALTARLVAAQRSDGAWSYAGNAATPSVPTTARALWALDAAAEAGLAVPPQTLDAALAAAGEQFRTLSQQDDEAKAALLFSLALHGRGDFGAANRLHRARNGLSPAALAYTALALVAMDRVPMAGDLAAILEGRAVFESGERENPRSCRFPVAGNDAFHRVDVEMGALALLALQRARPGSGWLEPGARWLVDHRPWFHDRARGMAVAALAELQGETRPASERARVVISVEGDAPVELELGDGRPGERLVFELPDGPGAATVDLDLVGNARPHWSVTLRGFSRDLSAPEKEAFRLRHQRVLAAAPLYRGKAVPTGFGVLRHVRESWENHVRHLPLGESAQARVSWRHDVDRDLRDAEVEHLILEVPLPAGAQVLDGSVTGSITTHEVRDGKLIAHLGQRRGSGTLYYTLIGTHLGSSRALPPVLRSTIDASRVAVGSPVELDVLPRGSESPDDYRPTPDELFHLGLRGFAAGERDAARTHLTALFEGFERDLRDDKLKEAARALLSLAIERTDSPRVVRYFEVLKEKDPTLWIPFDEVVAVGEAYRELEEYERALFVFRATVEETFGKDLKVPGTLEGLGELSDALDTLEALCDEYPDLPSVVEARLTLSDKLLLHAPNAHEVESLARAGRDRATLVLQGILLLQRFLTLHPESPLAPDAALNLVSAYLELDDYEGAATLAAEMATLWDDPRYADAFLYTRAVAEWHQANDETALELLRGIAAASYPDELGAEQPSENRELALYILGQIHHARREAAEAASYYERVAEVFADAKEALDLLREKGIDLDEVTTARPGEPVALPVRWRNVRSAELLVYPVDLMTLYLREQSLANVTGVNLAGIAPTLRKTVELGEGEDLRERSRDVTLELDEPGAYLVLARGEELFTSGLVLVSDLEVEVRSDPVSGRMRIQVLDRGDGRYVRDVDVRVVGSANGEFVSGKTDPRGLFVADAIQGVPTVVARLGDDQYAFHRGERALGAAGRPAQAGVQLRALGYTDGQLDDKAYLQNVFELNRGNQEQREQNFQTEYKRPRRGVQVQSVQ